MGDLQALGGGKNYHYFVDLPIYSYTVLVHSYTVEIQSVPTEVTNCNYHVDRRIHFDDIDAGEVLPSHVP